MSANDLLAGATPATKAIAEQSERVHANRALSLRASLDALVAQPHGFDRRDAAKLAAEIDECEIAAGIARQWAKVL